MKPQERWIVGKTIAKVKIESFIDDMGGGERQAHDLQSIVFTDGSCMSFHGVPGQADYFVEVQYFSRRRVRRIKGQRGD